MTPLDVENRLPSSLADTHELERLQAFLSALTFPGWASVIPSPDYFAPFITAPATDKSSVVLGRALSGTASTTTARVNQVPTGKGRQTRRGHG